MSDKKEMPVSGGGPGKGQPDGVSGMPDNGERGRVHGRLSGGESSGGAYPHPGSGKDHSGSPGHGGQSEIAYHGGDNPNATTRGAHEPDDSGAKSAATPIREAHSIGTGGHGVEVVEDSGVAAAEATGKIGTDALAEEGSEKPGAG